MVKRENISYWSMSPEKVLEYLDSNQGGLSAQEAAARLEEYGQNTIRSKKSSSPLMLFFKQFTNPIIMILITATLISAATGSFVDSMIILAIVLASALLSFLQEYSASNAVKELQAKVQVRSMVLRNGETIEVPARDVVPGDIVLLSAGSLIPADGTILECNELFVNQSILTGESIPSEKKVEPVPQGSGLDERQNSLFMGTSVRSGTAKMLVVQTGENTEFGQIAEQLVLRPPETDFERGVRHFGYLLTQIMLFLTLIVFAINVILAKPAIDSLLFSVALAVGITPQLLPAIISITLSKGSKEMAKEGVIVRRLTSIENFGSMDVLCTDKTGTLTEGVVRLDGAVDTDGNASEEVFRLAYLNASLQMGISNPLDEAIVGNTKIDISSVKKAGEIPYDFSRKRLSIVVQEDDKTSLITKGALKNILDVCSRIQVGSNEKAIDPETLESVNKRFANWSNQGFRILGVARKPIQLMDEYRISEESSMIFMGFLMFFDPPKADVAKTISELMHNGVNLRIITGDNKLVALHTASTVGLNITGVLTGSEIMKLRDEALWGVIENTNLFAEVDPNQKERIILAIKKKGHVVGYMGDGINDAPALHAADVSISVDTAVDVAKESADFVLIEKSLEVLNRGIELGRTTFANTLKYILITTSANFGNMFSMAGASLIMPFLPLMPKQILLINFLTDFPAITIASDSVDQEILERPRAWDIKFIRNFMVVFGLISSVFDYLTFAVMFIGFNANQELFQSSWFTLSIITELLILMVMRTQKPFFKSRPAPILLYSTLGVGIITLLLPYLPVKKILSIEPIPPLTLIALLGIAALYIITTEIAKHYFYGIRLKKLKS